MSLVLKSIYSYYNSIFNDFKDSRVENFSLVGSPIPVVFIILLYLLFILKWGPLWMKGRKPFNIQKIMQFYNFFQIISNSGMVLYAISNSYIRSDFSFICQPIDPHNYQPYMKRLIFATYLYYINKYIDLLDSVFFILRKKNNHLSFLHIYHHAGMVFGTYVAMKFLAGSHVTLLGIINGIVHVVMYFYYFITSLKPEYKKYIWWKKHITQLQILQFAYLIVHFTFSTITKNCSFPTMLGLVGVIQNSFMLILFSDFYYNTYIKKGDSKHMKNH